MTGRVIVLQANAKTLPLADASVDAVVTDPPYGLEFMGRGWDAPWRGGINADAGFSRVGMSDGVRLPRPSYTGSTNPGCRNCGGRQRGRRDGTAIWKTCTCAQPSFPNIRATEMQAFQDWCTVWAAECLRVLKPGGHLLAFGGTRTWHRLASAIEDAGFEIRDSVADLTGTDGPGLLWLYGSGFPKSLDVSKAIDKAAGAEREVIAEGTPLNRMIPGADQNRTGSWIKDSGREYVPTVTEAATEEAARWSGWGTALKPAWEPVVVGRKPLAGTVAGNVMAHGTGALNIDGCRVSVSGEQVKGSTRGHDICGGRFGESKDTDHTMPAYEQHDAGRWPPNVLLTHSADCQPLGVKRVRGITGGTGNHDGAVYGARSNAGAPVRDYADADGMETVEAWRCADDCPVAELDRQSGQAGAFAPVRGTEPSAVAKDAYGQRGRVSGAFHSDAGGASRFFPVFRYEAKAGTAERPRLPDGTAWPTVKPVALMQWLVRLVTPPGGTVLDLFCGTGTTGQAALIEGFSAVLIDKDPQAIALTRVRLARPVQPLMFQVPEPSPPAGVHRSSRTVTAAPVHPSLFDADGEAS